MTSSWVNALEVCLSLLESTFFDKRMMRAVAKVKTTGKIFMPNAIVTPKNPEYMATMVPYVWSVFGVLNLLESTYKDNDMIRAVRKAKARTIQVAAASAILLRPEYPYNVYPPTLSAYMPSDKSYLASIREVVNLLESKFKDLRIIAAASVLRSAF